MGYAGGCVTVMPCGMSCFSHACSSSTTHHMANATTSWLPARSRSTRADGPDAREEAHWNPRSESAASQFLYPCMLALVRAYSFSWTACRPSSSMLVELVHELNGSTCSPSVWANERKWLTGRLQSSSPSVLKSGTVSSSVQEDLLLLAPQLLHLAPLLVVVPLLLLAPPLQL